MKPIIQIAILINLGLALSGCTFAEMNSIHRAFDTNSTNAQLIDAKQRSILVGKKLTWNADKGRWEYGPVVCAEPSPDALTVLASSGTASLDNPGGTSASVAAALGESGGSIGLRTQSIQLLRDRFYRLCEAYMSGAIDAEAYDIEQRRLSNQMIAVLAIEQLTGAVRAPSILISSSGSAAAATNLGWALQRRDQIKDRLDKIPDEKAKQQKIVDDNSSKTDEASKKLAADANTEIQKLEEEKARLEEEQTVVTTTIENAKQAVASATTTGTIEPGVNTSGLNPASAEHVAKAVTKIATMVLKADYGPQVCLSYLRYHTTIPAVKPPIAVQCDKILDKYVALMDSDAKVMLAGSHILESHAALPKTDKNLKVLSDFVDVLKSEDR